MDSNPPLWHPSVTKTSSPAIADFAKKFAPRSFQEQLQLHNWSVSNPTEFWSSVADFCALRFSLRGDTVFETSSSIPWAKWFPGSQLNFAENLLRHSSTLANQDAILSYDENGLRTKISFGELNLRVGQLAQAFRKFGLKPGEVVASFLPNLSEAVIAMLAATSIGAIWTAASPNFLAPDALARFNQSKPRILIAADGYRFNNKDFDSLARIKEITSSLPSLELTLIVGNLNTRPAIGAVPRAALLSDFISAHPLQAPTFTPLPSEHPVYIMYSSGTTGAPKCIVHGAIGLLLEHFKELVLHTDLGPKDRMIYCTTGAWMMWNWLVSALGVGSTIVLYDGSFLHRDGKTLLDLIDSERLSVFGTSAAVLAEFEKRGLDPSKSHKLSSLTKILSTGSRLRPSSFDYVYRSFPKSVQLSSIWGGTDLCGCLGLGSPILPVRRGEIQAASLGIDLKILRVDGSPAGLGEAGEVACMNPFPSMPVRFLNDPLGEKYFAAYFLFFDGKLPKPVWRHGDLAILSPDHGIVMLERSDETLNPGGVRIGPVEITDAAERVAGVLDSMAVGQEWEGDERIILFVRLVEGRKLTSDLEQQIQNQMPTPSHRPRKIIAVPEFPTTKNGKLSSRAIRDFIHGRPIENAAALDNPACLEFFKV